MEDGGLFFNDLKLDNVPLKSCEIAFKSAHDNYRLYVLKYRDKRTFYAHAVSFHSCPFVEGNASIWENNHLKVNILFTAIAYFDGVRHLEFNRNGNDEDGYIYYPNMKHFITMFQKIREIEIEICPDAEK